MKAKTKTIAGEATYAGTLRAPRAGSPIFVFVSAFVCVFVSDGRQLIAIARTVAKIFWTFFRRAANDPKTSENVRKTSGNRPKTVRKRPNSASDMAKFDMKTTARRRKL